MMIEESVKSVEDQLDTILVYCADNVMDVFTEIWGVGDECSEDIRNEWEYQGKWEYWSAELDDFLEVLALPHNDEYREVIAEFTGCINWNSVAKTYTNEFNKIKSHYDLIGCNWPSEGNCANQDTFNVLIWAIYMNLFKL